MAKYRTSGTALARIFEHSSSLIFLVAEDWTIQYANPACGTWLQADVDALFGRKLVYTSELLESDLANRLASICPPPDAFNDPAGEPGIRFFISAPSSINGVDTLRYRLALAFPIFDAEHEETFLLVVSHSDELDERPSAAIDEFDLKELHAALAEIRRQSKLTHTLDTLVGLSPFAIRLRRQVEMIANSQTDVLIIGPRGSGRQFVARTIHANRPEPISGDLIPVDCSLADPELIRTIVSELGRKQRSSPLAAKQGLSQKPIDTLLLQEVDLSNGPLQTELLNSIKSSKVSISYIATSQCDIRSMAKEREFDNELAAILGTATIELPPLWQRAEDIPLLAQAILERPDRKLPVAGFDKTAMQKLAEYRWPGNLDQFSKVVEASAQHAKNRLLTVDDLPKNFHDSLRAQQFEKEAETTIHLESYLESIEKELLLRALLQAKGNKTAASRLLGLNRAKLLRRMQHFGLDQSDEGGSEDSSFESKPVKPKSKSDQRKRFNNRKLVDLASNEALAFPANDSSLDDEQQPNEDDSDWITPDAFEEIE